MCLCSYEDSGPCACGKIMANSIAQTPQKVFPVVPSGQLAEAAAAAGGPVTTWVPPGGPQLGRILCMKQHVYKNHVLVFRKRLFRDFDIFAVGVRYWRSVAGLSRDGVAWRVVGLLWACLRHGLLIYFFLRCGASGNLRFGSTSALFRAAWRSESPYLCDSKKSATSKTCKKHCKSKKRRKSKSGQI